MQHRGPRLSKKRKALVATAVALTALAGVTAAQAGGSSKKCVTYDLWLHSKNTAEVFKGSGRLDTKAYSVDIG